ncbi:hypothetical protein Naga_103136g1, partial [Nannochloropsis gaditana]
PAPPVPHASSEDSEEMAEASVTRQPPPGAWRAPEREAGSNVTGDGPPASAAMEGEGAWEGLGEGQGEDEGSQSSSFASALSSTSPSIPSSSAPSALTEARSPSLSISSCSSASCSGSSSSCSPSFSETEGEDGREGGHSNPQSPAKQRREPYGPTLRRTGLGGKLL